MISTAPVVIIHAIVNPYLSSNSGAVSSQNIDWSSSKNSSYSVRLGGTNCSTGTELATGTVTAGTINTTTISYSSLTVGLNTIRICATDSSVNLTGSNTFLLNRDDVAPTVGGSVATSNITSTTLTLSWAKATDNYVVPGTIQYKVVMSTGNNISTVSEAETADSSKTLLQDWTADISSINVSSLIAGSTYYFSVLTKDSADNKSIYATKTQATVPPPSNLSYSSSPIMLGSGLAIDFSILPTVTSTVRAYSVSPSLPTGLTIDATTGAITGTPAATQNASNYTVTASNGEGSSTTAIISIKVGNYGACYSWGCFQDMGDGTVRFEGTAGTFGGNTYTAQNLTFMKCSQGQTWNSTTNSCNGSAGTYQYCSTSDNSCNSDGTGNPAWTLNGTGSSSAYTTCNSIGTFAGKTGWRVPTKNELKILIHCSSKTMPNDYSGCSSSTSPAINNLFPNTIAGYYWSSTAYSSSSDSAWYVNFSSGYTNYPTKGNSFYVRCVSGQ